MMAFLGFLNRAFLWIFRTTIATFLAIALFDKKGEQAVFSFLNVELVTDFGDKVF